MLNFFVFVKENDGGRAAAVEQDTEGVVERGVSVDTYKGSISMLPYLQGTVIHCEGRNGLGTKMSSRSQSL